MAKHHSKVKHHKEKAAHHKKMHDHHKKMMHESMKHKDSQKPEDKAERKEHREKKTNFIASAIKHPGALRKELHVKKGHKIPVKKLEKATHAKGKEGQRARLAMTLRKMKHKK